MKSATSSLARPVVLAALLCLLTMAVSFAQMAPATSLPAVVSPSPSPLADKAIERLHTEDAGARIDEVRVGGQTQSITVQPKTGPKLPSYEVRPLNGLKGGADSSLGSDTNGPRVWNVLKF